MQLDSIRCAPTQLQQRLQLRQACKAGSRTHKVPEENGLRYRRNSRTIWTIVELCSCRNILQNTCRVYYSLDLALLEHWLQEHSLKVLQTAVENFRHPVFPCALIAGDVVILDLLSKLGYLESGKVKVAFIDTFHLFEETHSFLHRLEVSPKYRSWMSLLIAILCTMSYHFNLHVNMQMYIFTFAALWETGGRFCSRHHCWCHMSILSKYFITLLCLLGFLMLCLEWQ